MRKLYLIVLIAVVMSMASCKVMVTNKTTYDQAIHAVQSRLENQGFQAIGSDSILPYPNAKSKYSMHQDTYRFADSLGNAMKYSVTYSKGKSKKGDYVYDAMLCGCETSNPNDYERLCGDEDLLKPIKDLPKDRNVAGETVPRTILALALYLALVNGAYIALVFGLKKL